MSSPIVTCGCGTKVRLPEGAEGRTFRCPNCQAALTAPSLATVVSSAPVGEGVPAVCPICQCAIGYGVESATCSTCDQVHHQECWQEIGGCGTYGCKEAPAIDKSEATTQQPLSAWGDTKKCPACHETIKAIALRCRYCGTDFSSVDPLSIADLHRQANVTAANDKFKKQIVALFVLAIVGLLAPLVLLGGLAFIYPRREQLSKCGPVFAIMGWAAIILSAIYSLLILVFLIIG